MFERYNEKARRVIFFSRYEATQFGSRYIETEHLLLGLTREDAAFRNRLLQSLDSLESLRKQIASERTIGEKVSTSVDLPLSPEFARVLAYASEEAQALQHDVIDPGHLVLGLLRIKDCLAARLVRQHGINYDDYREIVRAGRTAAAGSSESIPSRRIRPVERSSAWQEAEESPPAAPSLHSAIAVLQALLDRVLEHLDMYSEAYGQQRLKRKSWSRKEALGHLVDLATAHHQWLARALAEPKLAIAVYPQDEWVAAQEYRSVSWPDIVDSWICLNRLFVHVLRLIPEQKLKMECRIGFEDPITLLTLIDRYIQHCDEIVGQIVSRL